MSARGKLQQIVEALLDDPYNGHQRAIDLANEVRHGGAWRNGERVQARVRKSYRVECGNGASYAVTAKDAREARAIVARIYKARGEAIEIRDTDQVVTRWGTFSPGRDCGYFVLSYDSDAGWSLSSTHYRLARGLERVHAVNQVRQARGEVLAVLVNAATGLEVSR